MNRMWLKLVWNFIFRSKVICLIWHWIEICLIVYTCQSLAIVVAVSSFTHLLNIEFQYNFVLNVVDYKAEAAQLFVYEHISDRITTPTTSKTFCLCHMEAEINGWHSVGGFFNTLRPGQNGRHFADDILKCIFLNENVRISIEISLKFVPKGPIDNIPALV